MVAIPGYYYLIGKYEVTQSQWESVMGMNPSGWKGADNPVETVSWNDCQEFLEKLNSLPEVRTSGLVFRLPTAGEWASACRAGATGDYCKLANGTEITQRTLGEVAWFSVNSDYKTHPVGQKQPNAFGLYDMLGNVWEWTQTADDAGDGFRVHRPIRANCGGSWNENAWGCWSSSDYLGWNWPDVRDDRFGFRLCAEKRQE